MKQFHTKGRENSGTCTCFPLNHPSPDPATAGPPSPRLAGREQGEGSPGTSSGLAFALTFYFAPALAAASSPVFLSFRERANFPVQLLGLAFGFQQWLAFVHARPPVADIGKPRILEQALALLHQLEKFSAARN